MYSGRKFRQERERQGFSQYHLAGKAGVCERTLHRIENNDPNANVAKSTVQCVARALGKPLTFFRIDDDDGPTAEEGEICRIMCIAVVYAMKWVRYVLSHPYSVRNGPPDPEKITDCSLEEDPTELVDKATADAIKEVLTRAAGIPNNPLAQGYRLIDEETGVTDHPGTVREASEIRYVFACDSSDDTSLFSRNLGGTVLISCYRKGTGWIAAAAGDFTRMRLYSRVRGRHTLAISLSPQPGSEEPPVLNNDTFVTPTGIALDMAPAQKTSLKGASICIYMGKPERILRTAEQGKRLLAKATGIKETFSFGGSRGPILVAEGLIHAAVEYVKGFRRHDFIPGAFLAQGVGAAVVDLEGCEIDFGVDGLLEKIVEDRITRRERYIALRQKFIVAATRDLANDIITCLKEPGK